MRKSGISVNSLQHVFVTNHITHPSAVRVRTCDPRMDPCSVWMSFRTTWSSRSRPRRCSSTRTDDSRSDTLPPSRRLKAVAGVRTISVKSSVLDIILFKICISAEHGILIHNTRIAASLFHLTLAPNRNRHMNRRSRRTFAHLEYRCGKHICFCPARENKNLNQVCGNINISTNRFQNLL